MKNHTEHSPTIRNLTPAQSNAWHRFILLNTVATASQKWTTTHKWGRKRSCVFFLLALTQAKEIVDHSHKGGIPVTSTMVMNRLTQDVDPEIRADLACVLNVCFDLRNQSSLHLTDALRMSRSHSDTLRSRGSEAPFLDSLLDEDKVLDDLQWLAGRPSLEPNAPLVREAVVRVSETSPYGVACALPLSHVPISKRIREWSEAVCQPEIPIWLGVPALKMSRTMTTTEIALKIAVNLAESMGLPDNHLSQLVATLLQLGMAVVDTPRAADCPSNIRLVAASIPNTTYRQHATSIIHLASVIENLCFSRSRAYYAPLAAYTPAEVRSLEIRFHAVLGMCTEPVQKSFRIDSTIALVDGMLERYCEVECYVV